MVEPVSHKPALEEWLYWAQVVIDRLTTCVHIYNKPPHEDIFVREAERQQKSGRLIELLRRIHPLIDESETPSDSLEEMDGHGERVVAGLKVLMEETLKLLPGVSTDMQTLLKSSWYNKCNGRLAEELFRGPMGHEPEGIGSGHPEHGRLPAVLQSLIAIEEAGDSRPPRAMLGGEKDGPTRQIDLAKQWGERNSRILRSAGRIE